jgi:DNA-binding response OmpR family regulator
MIYRPFVLVYEEMDPYTLLVIARSQSLAKRLRAALDAEQYLIRWVPSATQALKLDLKPSLLVLDLPPSGGTRGSMWLKKRFQVSLLVLSIVDVPVPRRADASLPLNCDMKQLVTLIETTLMAHSPHMVRAGSMSLDTQARRLQVNGTLYQLRPIGCRILALLMARAGSVVSRQELFRRVWCTDDGDSTRALDVHVAHLRRILEPDPRHPMLILTERGVGYWLQPPD